jgi:membrane protease YdiL (CAAX protease family)
MRDNIKESIVYVLLVYMMTWIFWSPVVISNEFFVGESILILFGTYMPSVIGLIMAMKCSKKSNISSILRSMLKIKIKIKEYIVIFSYFPIMIILFFFITKIMGDDFLLYYPIKVFPLVFTYILVLQGPLAEEFGWRGFLMVRLMKSYSLYISSFIIGVVWSFWHIPRFFMEGTIQWQMVEKFSLLPTISGYIIYTVLISVLISIIFIRTNGSVWAAILFHTIANTTIGYAANIMTGGGSFVILTALLIVTFAAVKLNTKNEIKISIE